MTEQQKGDEPNPYAGIAEACTNNWQKTTTSTPLTIEMLQRGFDAIEEHARAEERQRTELVERLAAMTSEERRVWNAQQQAANELLGNWPIEKPRIVHPNQYKAVMKRAEEILNGAD